MHTLVAVDIAEIDSIDHRRATEPLCQPQRSRGFRVIHCRKKNNSKQKPGFTEFLQVLLGLTCFYRTSLGVTWLNLILTVFYRVLPSSTGFLPSFTGFNLFLPDFPRFHLVKPGFIEFVPSFRKSVFHLVTRFRLSVLRGWDPFWTRRHFDEEMAVGFRFSFFFTLAHWSARAEETTCFVSLPRRP